MAASWLSQYCPVHKIQGGLRQGSTLTFATDVQFNVLSVGCLCAMLSVLLDANGQSSKCRKVALARVANKGALAWLV